MNVDNGKIYHGAAAIASAEARGEPLEDITPNWASDAPEQKEWRQRMKELHARPPKLKLPLRKYAG